MIWHIYIGKSCSNVKPTIKLVHDVTCSLLKLCTRKIQVVPTAHYKMCSLNLLKHVMGSYILKEHSHDFGQILFFPFCLQCFSQAFLIVIKFFRVSCRVINYLLCKQSSDFCLHFELKWYRFRPKLNVKNAKNCFFMFCSKQISRQKKISLKNNF